MRLDKRWRVLSICCAILSLGWVYAQSPEPAGSGEADTARAIDQKLNQLAISDLAITDALADIGKQIGVPITIDDATVELLPWGRQTKLAAVTISNMSVRDALPQVLAALGMTYEVRDGGIAVTATPPLKRLGRRATWDDLKLLRFLSETEYTPESFDSLKIQYRISSKVDAKKMLLRQLANSGRGSVAEMLETATGSLNWIWVPESDHVVVKTSEAQVNNKLARLITARYSNTPLSQIFGDLAARADVALSFEPGVMTKLPLGTTQSYTLLLQSTSIRQAMELICAETGLKYAVVPDGVFISASESLAGGSAQAARPSPYVAKISVPGSNGKYTLEFLIRGDEVPEDILSTRKQMLEEVIQEMRRDVVPDDAPPSSGEPKGP
jgi:hypothetical protein